MSVKLYSHWETELEDISIWKWRDISTNITYQVFDMEKVGEKVQEEYFASLHSRENEQFKV